MTKRSAVVTGAAQGIGRAIAARLAEQMPVWCIDADTATLQTTVTELGRTGADVRALPCDVSDHEQIRAAWSYIDADDSVVDRLVNNAGIFPRTAALDIEPDEWDRVMDVNLAGSFFMAQHAVRRLVNHDLPGAIVGLGSGQAFAPVPRTAHYSASKAAIVNLTRVLAAEWGPLRVRVNTVVPGLIDTAMPRAVIGDGDISEYAAGFPLRRVGTPDDIASAVLFLLSDAASYITGQALHVNGGSLML